MRMLSPLSNSMWPRSSLGSSLFDDFFSDIDRVLDSVATPTVSQLTQFQPSCDISETKDYFMVSFDMPGIKKDDVKIEVTGNQLVVTGERYKAVGPNEGEEEGLRHRERLYGKFQRSFTLPTSINADKIEAHYEDGVLNIALPKSEQAKGRSIQIQSGKGSFLNRMLGGKKDVRDVKDVKAS